MKDLDDEREQNVSEIAGLIIFLVVTLVVTASFILELTTPDR